MSLLKLIVSNILNIPLDRIKASAENMGTLNIVPVKNERRENETKKLTVF